MFGKKKTYYKLSAEERGMINGAMAVAIQAQAMCRNELQEIARKRHVPDGAVYDPSEMAFVKALRPPAEKAPAAP